jgi:hypothetical protein
MGGVTGVMLAVGALQPPGPRHLLRRRALPLRPLRQRASSRSSPGSTTGSRRSRAACSRSGWGVELRADVRGRPHLTFFPQHQLGFMGMPRRVFTYLDELGWGMLNLISTVGASSLALGVLVFLVNRRSATTRRGRRRQPVERGLARVGDRLAAAEPTTSSTRRAWTADTRCGGRGRPPSVVVELRTIGARPPPRPWWTRSRSRAWCCPVRRCCRSSRRWPWRSRSSGCSRPGVR